MWQGDYPFLGYQVYSLGNQETGQYESGGNTILPNLIGGCGDGFEIDPKENTQAMTLGCTDSNSSNFNPEATTDDGSCDGNNSMSSVTGLPPVSKKTLLVLLTATGLAINAFSLHKRFLPSK